MRIQINIDSGDPPSGMVLTAARPATPFAGWLELFRVISDLIEQEEKEMREQSAAR